MFCFICKTRRQKQNAVKLTAEESMTSCFSLVSEKKTEDVIPAKQVTAAALTCQKKQSSTISDGTTNLNMQNNKRNELAYIDIQSTSARATKSYITGMENRTNIFYFPRLQTTPKKHGLFLGSDFHNRRFSQSGFFVHTSTLRDYCQATQPFILVAAGKCCTRLSAFQFVTILGNSFFPATESQCYHKLSSTALPSVTNSPLPSRFRLNQNVDQSSLCSIVPCKEVGLIMRSISSKNHYGNNLVARSLLLAYILSSDTTVSLVMGTFHQERKNYVRLITFVIIWKLWKE